MSVRVVDLRGIEVEHGIGERLGPFVVLRVLADRSLIVLGQLPPATARQVAEHLLSAAARAEYEADLLDELQRRGVDDTAVGIIVSAVRSGEHRRHTSMG